MSVLEANVGFVERKRHKLGTREVKCRLLNNVELSLPSINVDVGSA